MYYISPSLYIAVLHVCITALDGRSRGRRVIAGYLRFMSMNQTSMQFQPLSPSFRRHSNIPPLPDPPHPRPNRRPTQQPHRRANKDEHNRLVLCTIPLEARRQDLLLLLAFAEAVAQAEGAVAVVAGLAGGGGGLRGIEGDDGGVAEAGAFAEGCWCCGVC
jgi:hypothetical protein